MERKEISVVIQTCNSEATLRRCLESVREFDEIVVCDMYSSDRTVAIAGEYGCRVVMHRPCGICEPARTFAILHASGEWVLVVDSDEIVPPELRTCLYDRIKRAGCPEAFRIPRCNFFMQTFMHGAFPDRQLRFFRRSAFVNWPETIHSRPLITGRTASLPRRRSLAFLHLEMNDLRTWVTKLNRYADHETERRKRGRCTILKLVFKPPYRFFHLYFLKGGFLDGKAGLIFALLHAFYRFLTIARIAEHRQIGRDS